MSLKTMINDHFGGTWAVMHTELRLRVRSLGFWVLVTLFAIVTYLALPPRSAGYAFLTAAHQGVFTYDSGFVGMISGFISTLLFGLIGFFLAHNSMRRDRITPAGEILAATSVTSAGYLLGKYLAAACALGILLGVSLGTGVIAQHVRGEATVALSSFLPPLLLLPAPTLLYTVGLGVAAGSLPCRGSGLAFSLLYVAYWFATLWGVLTISFVRTALWIDYTGFIIPSFEVAREYYGSAVLGAAPPGAQLLRWPDLSLRVYILPRLVYALVGLALAVLGLLWFRRFDPDRSLAA